MTTQTHPKQWIEIRPQGIYCAPGDFFIDPTSAVPRALITHGHADHARAGHDNVLATKETLAIMASRYGAAFATSTQAAPYGEKLTHNGVEIEFAPAGHILGSAQIKLSWGGSSIVFSGDYKRRRDPTCPPFEVMHADVFVTEATFGLPVFVHPPIEHEIGKLLTSFRQFPERCHLIGVYSLGKAQRVICHLREAGYDEPIYLHGALVKLCQLYEDFGIALGPLIPVADKDRANLAGCCVLCPPSALHDRWASRLPDPVTAAASGWMRIRARAKQQAVELPLVISDHADWPELLQTLTEVAAPEVWVTHGREEALIHVATQMQIRAQALSLLMDDEEDD
jgi:putative mRNA 3-end processing factor